MYSTKIREIIGSILSKETPNEETIESFVSLLEILSSVVPFSEKLESFAREICAAIERFIDNENLCLRLIDVVAKYLSGENSKYQKQTFA